MKRDRTLTELMDDPLCDPSKLLTTYKQFRLVNWIFSSWKRIYLKFIRPHLTDTEATYTLLDVGCGLMDNAKFIQKLALNDGYTIHITGIDPNPTVYHFLKKKGKDSKQQFFPSYLHEVDPDLRFDFVISNHLIHHLEEDQIGDLHLEIASRTKKIAIMNDINRSLMAYFGFTLLTLPYAGWTFIHTDGKRSIKRSFISHELVPLLPSGWVVRTMIPYRLLSIYEPN